MGRPRYGPYYARWQSARLRYRTNIRESKRKERTASCEPLTAAFINCDVTSFWKNWRQRFSNKAGNPLVDNVCEPTLVANTFAEFFCDISNSTVKDRDIDLYNEYLVKISLHSQHFYVPGTIDAGMVESYVNQLEKGKSAGMD